MWVYNKPYIEEFKERYSQWGLIKKKGNKMNRGSEGTKRRTRK